MNEYGLLPFGQTRIDLFGSTGVSEAVTGIVATNDGPRSIRHGYFEILIKKMRLDLHK